MFIFWFTFHMWCLLLDCDYFCRYFDSQLTSCTPFYDTSTSRSNPFVVSTLVNRLDDICQRTVDDTKTDFFSFLFPTWVKRIDTSSLKIDIQVTARLQVCSSISADPKLRKLQQQKTTLSYLVASQSFSFLADGVTPTNAPTGAPTHSPSVAAAEEEEDDDDDNALALGLGLGIGLPSTIIVIYLIVRYMKNRKSAFSQVNIDGL